MKVYWLFAVLLLGSVFVPHVRAGGGLGDGGHTGFDDDDNNSIASIADPLLDDNFWGGEEPAEIPEDWNEFKFEDDVMQDVNGLGDNLGIFWTPEAFDGYQEALLNDIAEGHAPEASSSSTSSSSSSSSTAYLAPEISGSEDLITVSVDLPMSNGASERVLQIPDDDDAALAAEPVRSRPKRNRASFNVDDMEHQYLTSRGGKRAKGAVDVSEQASMLFPEDIVDEILCGGDSKEEELCTQCALPASQHPSQRSLCKHNRGPAEPIIVPDKVTTGQRVRSLLRRSVRAVMEISERFSARIHFLVRPQDFIPDGLDMLRLQNDPAYLTGFLFVLFAVLRMPTSGTEGKVLTMFFDFLVKNRIFLATLQSQEGKQRGRGAEGGSGSTSSPFKENLNAKKSRHIHDGTLHSVRGEVSGVIMQVDLIWKRIYKSLCQNCKACSEILIGAMSSIGHNLNSQLENPDGMRLIGADAQNHGSSHLVHLFVRASHSCLSWDDIQQITSDPNMFPLSAITVWNRLQSILSLNRQMALFHPAIALRRTLQLVDPLTNAIRYFGWRFTDVLGDGRCGFRALAFLMNLIGANINEQEVRHGIAGTLDENAPFFKGSAEEREIRIRSIRAGQGSPRLLYADDDTHTAFSKWQDRIVVVWNHAGITIIDANGAWNGNLCYAYGHPQFQQIVLQLEQLGAMMLAHTGNHYMAIHR